MISRSDLTDQDYVRRLRAGPVFEGIFRSCAYRCPPSRLADHRFLVGVSEFDWVFDGQDMPGELDYGGRSWPPGW